MPDWALRPFLALMVSLNWEEKDEFNFDDHFEDDYVYNIYCMF